MRSFKNFESIANGDFVAFTEGYHVVTITGHKEDVSKKGQDIDVFELTSDTGATTNLTLYFGEKSLWTYKKLLTITGAKTSEMKGNVNIDFDKLIGRRFGCFVEIEEIESWNEEKGQTVTKKYPRASIQKAWTEEKTLELMETYVPKESKKDIDMTPINDDGDLPF